MATKEDILEQLVEEYLLHDGYFVRHNLKFLPRKNHPEFDSKQDSNHSDIDVIGYHPKRTGAERVKVVSCKSWQGGFNATAEIRNIENKKKVRGREAWRGFRELVVPKWSEAFISTIEAATGQQDFIYVTAVTRLIGDKSQWESNKSFIEALGGNCIRILDLREILESISPGLGTTLAGTEIGRMLQLLKAAGISIDPSTAKKS